MNEPSLRIVSHIPWLDATSHRVYSVSAVAKHSANAALVRIGLDMRSDAGLSYAQGLIVAAVVLVLLGSGMLGYELVWQVGAGEHLEKGALTDAQAQSIKVTLDLFTLLMSWALAIIGATGFFLKLNVEKGLVLQPSDLFLSLAIIVAAVLSLFFGHLGIDRTAELLSVQQDPVRNDGLRQLGKLQYLAFFSAVLLFGFHIFRFFWARAISPDCHSKD